MNVRNLCRSLLLLMFCATPLQEVMAQRWVSVAPTSELGVSVSIDNESIGRSDDYLKAWFKYSFATDQTGIRVPTFRSYLELAIFDCQNKRQATRSVVFYSSTEPIGQALLKHDFKTLEFQDPPPDTLGAQQVQVVCQSEAAKAR